MAKDLDNLALSCNIILEKLIYLYSNTLISRQQLLENSKLKIKFLYDNINNIESAEIKTRAIKILNDLNSFLTFEERNSWYFYSTPK